MTDEQSSYRMIYVGIFLFAAIWVWAMWPKRDESASSFVGYSQSCWQIGDSLYVVTAKGDTVRLDVSKFR